MLSISNKVARVSRRGVRRVFSSKPASLHIPQSALAVGIVATTGLAYFSFSERKNVIAAKDEEKKEMDLRLSNIENSLSEIEKKFSTTVDRNRSESSPKGKVDVVLGCQWGDEGKGKLVDILAGNYDLCARVAGGSNAGHTIVVDNVKYKFHLIPSAMLNPRSVGVIGNGVVIHIPTLLKEIEDLEKNGINFDNRLKISDRAHIVFDFHQQIDGHNEGQLGEDKLGTTKKGIGPAYSSKILRNGIRDFDEFEKRLRSLISFSRKAYGEVMSVDIDAELQYYRSVRDRILAMTDDTIQYVNMELKRGKKLLVEGANAAMLDIDFGTYPFVTSSNPTVGSACTGLGIAPHKIGKVFGTVKAYSTRVGEGPFPTELHDETGKFLLENGNEFGTTTGRPRRCGWLDIPQMKYSQMVNGYTALNLTKLDVLTGLKEIKICVGYQSGNKCFTGMPSTIGELSRVEVDHTTMHASRSPVSALTYLTVVYETLPGWTEDLSKCRTFHDLPANARKYIERVEQLVGVPIIWVGVGAGRENLVDCSNRSPARDH